MNQKIAALGVIIGFTGQLAGTPIPSSTDVTSCIEDLKMPGFLSSSVDRSVTVTVRLQPDSTGRARTMSFEAPDDTYNIGIRFAMEQSRFLPTCSGRSLQFKFTFEIGGT